MYWTVYFRNSLRLVFETSCLFYTFILLQNKNPAELLSLMNGDLSALSNILGSTDLLGILKTVIDSFFSSSPYGPIIQQYAGKFLESDQGRELMEGAKEMMGGLAESTSGQRMLKLAPQLMGVKDMQSLMEVGYNPV